MARAVLIGECMVEFGPAEAPGLFRMGFAGDTFNTAWYLRRLLPEGWVVDYLTAVGTDAVSDQMLTFFQEAGIGLSHVARLADASVGLYLIALTDGERSFSYWRAHSAARRLAEDDSRLRAALSGADLAYLSGITLAILPPQDRARLLGALADFRAQGGRVAFDPNLRPRLWPSHEGMTRTVTEAARLADIVLPSFDDETAFGDGDPASCARRYAGLGASEVVVKNGAGRIEALVDGTWHSHDPAPAPAVIDTTAAGDSFNAGYLAARVRGARVPEALAAGCALAARVVGGRGALVAQALAPSIMQGKEKT